MRGAGPAVMIARRLLDGVYKLAENVLQIDDPRHTLLGATEKISMPTISMF